jgi:FMN phosphatase YigB (HAD superfamily)
MRAVLFAVEETLVPEQTLERWQWSWRPQGPVISERHLRAAVKRTLHRWDRRRWAGLTGAERAVDAAAYREHLRDTLAAIAGHPLPPAETEAVVDRFLRAPVLRRPLPEVSLTLERLRREGRRVGAIGARPGPSAAEALQRSGLAPYIDVVTGGDPAGAWPPAPEAFRAAAASLGHPPRETAFVGHLYWSEVRAAARAGFVALLLDRDGWWPRVEGTRLDRLAELPEVLARLEAAPASSSTGAPGAPDPGSP